ncbi:MAG: hypothetical protein AB4372_28960 [Xenococcus sp. (in: cyanobacteria)]
MRTWFNNLRKPEVLIALATLIVTSIGVFAGVQFFSDQSIESTEDCIVDTVGQKSNGKPVKQTVICSEGSTIKNVTQE